MDFASLLKGEIASKRRAVEDVAGPQAKYVKRGDLEAKRQQDYLEEQRRKEALRIKKDEERAATPEAPTSTVAADGEVKERAVDIDAKEVIRRLRARGEPIRLFGESDADRVQRLRVLEAKQPDDREGAGNAYQKTFLRQDHDIDLQELRKKEDAAQARDQDAGTVAAPKKVKKTMNDVLITEDMIRKDRDLLQNVLADYFELLVNEQSEALLARPEELKRTSGGKEDASNHEQTKENLKPLFKMLRKGTLAVDVMYSVAKIAQRMQEREYVRANDEYYLLSIGNAAWPIGVTMVGIHARSAREKIQSNQVAHALNDEKTRKWIQAIKRLCTFAEIKYPPEDVSKAVAYTRS